jgi:hypothetical protein
MGRLLNRAIEAAGLSDIQQSVLEGRAVSGEQLAQLRGADLLALAALADRVRCAFHGEEVRVFSLRAAAELRGAQAVTATVGLAADDARATGAEFLREVALLRLATPGAHPLAVSAESAGLELAQAALVFGANELLVDLAGKRTLPLLEGPEARRAELRGLCERAGRSVRFVERGPVDESRVQPRAEQRE